LLDFPRWNPKCNGLSELVTPHFSILLSRTFSNSLDNTGNREIAL